MPPRDAWAEPFWRGLAANELQLHHCDACGHTRYPPVDARCPDCGRLQGWVAASGSARLWSWATFHREYHPGYPLPPPYTVMMVELPEGVRMLATLAPEVAPTDLHCDMALAFCPIELAPGIRIPGFRPASTQRSPLSGEPR